MRLAVDVEARALGVDVAPRAGDELARVALALADHLGDLVVGVGEDLAQQERRALDGREPLEQHEEGERERVGQLGLGARVAGALVGEQRLGQPRPDVLLAPHARGAQVVDRQAGGDGREVGLRALDLVGLRAVVAQERLLDDVLGLADAADHAVGDREQQRAQLGMQIGFGHRSLDEAAPVTVTPRVVTARRAVSSQRS